MSSDEPMSSADDAPSTRADSPKPKDPIPAEDQTTVNLTAADLRHTEPAATSVPPVVLPPVAPPSEVVPGRPGVDPDRTPPRRPVSPAGPRIPVTAPVSPAAVPAAGTKPSPVAKTPEAVAPVNPPVAPVIPPAPVAPVPVTPAPVPVTPAPEPTATEPTATKPAATEPVATVPAATEPVATVPVATEPVVSEPAPVARAKPKPYRAPKTGAPAEARKVVVAPRAEGGRAASAAAKPSRTDAESIDEAGDGPPGVPTDGSEEEAAPAPRRWSATTVMIAVLLLLFGFTLVVQLRANDGDSTLLTARQEDLVRILSDLESQEQRLQQEVATLEDTKQQLSSGVEGREAAKREAAARADDLGVLAGELPARGTGLVIRFNGGEDQVEADDLLNAVQELRGAGAEAMQIEGGDGNAVRIVASTSFQDAQPGQGGDARFGVFVDGKRLTSTYVISVIGEAKTMETALRIPGGVIESITDDGGNVTVQEQGVVDVSAIHDVTTLRYARPVS